MITEVDPINGVRSVISTARDLSTRSSSFTAARKREPGSEPDRNNTCFLGHQFPFSADDAWRFAVMLACAQLANLGLQVSDLILQGHNASVPFLASRTSGTFHATIIRSRTVAEEALSADVGLNGYKLIKFCWFDALASTRSCSAANQNWKPSPAGFPALSLPFLVGIPANVLGGDTQVVVILVGRSHGCFG